MRSQVRYVRPRSSSKDISAIGPTLKSCPADRVTRLDGVTVRDNLSPNDPQLVELYRASNAFVLPSRSETFGIAAVAAAASRLHVVASSVGRLPDIDVDSHTGLLVEPGKVSELERTLLDLENDPALRRRLGMASR